MLGTEQKRHSTLNMFSVLLKQSSLFWGPRRKYFRWGPYSVPQWGRNAPTPREGNVIYKCCFDVRSFGACLSTTFTRSKTK